MPFEPGNKLGQLKKTNKPFADMLRLVVSEAMGEKGSTRLRAIAESLVKRAQDGDVPAAKEVADRLDGKSVQAIANDGNEPLRIVIEKDDAKLL